ncbi:MAG: mechanosensitive ion channel domain-containing protein [Polyangiales bacterium]
MSGVRHLGLIIAVLACVTAPGAAQLLDPLASEATPQEKQRDEQSSSVDDDEEPPRKRPRWLAEPSNASAPDEETRSVEERSPLLVLFLCLLGVGVALFATERARAWVVANVPLTRIFGALVFVLRLVALGLLLAVVMELVPSGSREWLLWALLVFALVVGWSVRDLFADLVAGGVLAAERRVKKGMWVSGNGFQGTVEGRSLRATWLRDGQGHRLTVPNRAMVGAPMVYDAGAEAEHEVVVRLEGYHDAGKVRMALTDAILSSPWVLAGATPVVLRDPADPVVWRVRTRLLEPRFSLHFEGELLERVEDLLRYSPEPEERETSPAAAPADS